MKATTSLETDMKDGRREILVTEAVETAPMAMRPGVRLIIEKGATIKGNVESFRDSHDHTPLIDVRQCAGAKIEGQGLLQVPEDSEYAGQWRPCIAVASSNDTKIEGLVLNSRGGDGITIEDGTQHDKRLREPSRNTQIQNIICRYPLRNGISAIACDGLFIDHYICERSEGVAAEAGIAVEPNRPDQEVDGMVVSNSVILDPTGWGVEVQMSKHPLRVDLTLHRCTIHGGTRPAFEVIQWPAAPNGCRILLDDCNFISSGIAIKGESEGEPAIYFHAMKWAQVQFIGGEIGRAYQRPQSDLRFSLGSGELVSAEEFGNVFFLDLRGPRDCEVNIHPAWADRTWAGIQGCLRCRGFTGAERQYKTGLWKVG